MLKSGDGEGEELIGSWVWRSGSDDWYSNRRLTLELLAAAGGMLPPGERAPALVTGRGGLSPLVTFKLNFYTPGPRCSVRHNPGRTQIMARIAVRAKGGGSSP